MSKAFDGIRMNKLWIKFVEAIFPGSYEEYLEAKNIHKIEIKKYRKNPQFIVGFVLFFVPIFYMLLFLEGWIWKIIALVIVIGEMLIRDTISEHYCALINKERKTTSNNAIHSDGQGHGN